METIKDQLRNYICENLMGVETDELSDGDSLFREKRLDSLNMAELLFYLEKTFTIKINPLEITFENFDSLNELCQFIEKKKQA